MRLTCKASVLAIMIVLIAESVFAQGRDTEAIMKDIDVAFQGLKRATMRDEAAGDILRFGFQLDALLAETRRVYETARNRGAVSITETAMAALRRTMNAARDGDIRAAKFRGSELNDACVACHKVYRDYGDHAEHGATSVRVIAASRARIWGTGPSQLSPASRTEVILAVGVRGVAEADWRSDVFLSMAGRKERIPVARRVRWEGSDDRVAVFRVPSDAHRFVLHISNQSPIAFEVPDDIKDRMIGHP